MLSTYTSIIDAKDAFDEVFSDSLCDRPADREKHMVDDLLHWPDNNMLHYLHGRQRVFQEHKETMNGDEMPIHQYWERKQKLEKEFKETENQTVNDIHQLKQRQELLLNQELPLGVTQSILQRTLPLLKHIKRKERQPRAVNSDIVKTKLLPYWTTDNTTNSHYVSQHRDPSSTRTRHHGSGLEHGSKGDGNRRHHTQWQRGWHSHHRKGAKRKLSKARGRWRRR